MLTVWLELGIGGLALLLAVIYQFVSEGLSLYKLPESQLYGALLLALTAAICLDSMGLPTLYWEKLPTIALTIGVALVGTSEKAPVEVAEANYLHGADSFAGPFAEPL